MLGVALTDPARPSHIKLTLAQICKVGVHSALLQLSLNPKLPPHAGNGQINALFFVAADMAQGYAQRALGIVACFCEQPLRAFD